MKLWAVIAVLWMALAGAWILGNVFITYQTGVSYTGEPDYDHYHSTRPK